MPADLHDHNQLPAVLTTQVTPVNYQTPGALTTVTSVIISTPVASSQLSTQDNNFSGGITNWGWQQVAANATTYPLQSPLINQSPGVIGSATVATVVAPFSSASPVNTPTPGLTAVAAQISTQTNPSSGVGDGLNSITSSQQSLAVAGPTYNSPGGILNRVTPGGTGGGP